MKSPNVTRTCSRTRQDLDCVRTVEVLRSLHRLLCLKLNGRIMHKFILVAFYQFQVEELERLVNVLSNSRTGSEVLIVR